MAATRAAIGVSRRRMVRVRRGLAAGDGPQSYACRSSPLSPRRSRGYRPRGTVKRIFTPRCPAHRSALVSATM